MKITKKKGALFLVLQQNGEVELHLPYIEQERRVPRHIEEFLVLLGMWKSRDKQLIQRIEAKILSDKEKKERRKLKDAE